MPMKIEIDDLSRAEIHALLNEHLQSMYALSPPESVHALKELDVTHGEVKSMRTPQALRRKGAGRALLAHLIDVARARGYGRLSLETGTAEAFLPAQKLYESFGFTYCGPFGSYAEDPNSTFMTLRL